MVNGSRSFAREVLTMITRRPVAGARPRRYETQAGSAANRVCPCVTESPPAAPVWPDLRALFPNTISTAWRPGQCPARDSTEEGRYRRRVLSAGLDRRYPLDPLDGTLSRLMDARERRNESRTLRCRGSTTTSSTLYHVLLHAAAGRNGGESRDVDSVRLHVGRIHVPGAG